MTTAPDDKPQTPETELRSFLHTYEAKDQKLFRSARTALRKRFPTANELAYDYGHSVVIAYSPSELGIEGIVSIALRADGVRLYLMNGPQLPDPKRLLLGKGSQARYVPLETASTLASADVQALIAAAIARAKVPLSAKGKGRLLIKATAARGRTRRKPSK
jgi:hypothetical protein